MRIEAAYRLAALEQPVSEGSHLIVVILCPDRQVRCISAVRRPHVFRHSKTGIRIIRIRCHASGDRIVDPYRTVGALLCHHLFISFLIFKTAVPRKIQICYRTPGKRIRSKVDHLIEIECQIHKTAGIRKSKASDFLY